MLAVSPVDAQAASILAKVRVRSRRAAGRSDADISPLQWATENATIVLPTEGRQPFVPYDYQARFLNDTSRYRIILKSRQTGISNVIAIEALYRTITQPDRTILFVSRNQRLAAQLITYCRHTLNGLRTPPRLVTETQSEISFANDSRIISLPASPSTGRGFAASSVYLDEFAYCEHESLIYESVIGTIATGGDLTVNSTPNGRANMYFRLWAGLEGGDWSRHQIHWSDCPRYRDDPAWEPVTRASMTKQAFAQDYDLDFLTSGEAVFDPDDLVKARQDHNPDSTGCDELVTAWDIGRRQDHTVGITLGRRGDIWHEVEYQRMLVPYPVVQTKIDERNQARKGRCYVESNGVGDPVIENLTTHVTPFTTTTKTKTQAIQALQLLIQQGRLKYASDQLDRELGLYQWDDKDLVQDSVMAAAIAAFQIVHQPPAWTAY